MHQHRTARYQATGVDSRRAGAAMVELMVGLIPVLVLAATLVQFVSLNSAEYSVQTEARRQAGEAALEAMGSGLGQLSDAVFIADWDPAGDEKRHTRDDTFTPADATAFSDAIVTPTTAAAQDWQVLQRAPGDHISILHGAPNPSALFGLVRGRAEPISVPLLPAVRALVYRADAIEVEHEVWLSWTRGMY